MQPLRESFFVVPPDERVVLGEQGANPQVGVRFGISQMVNHHPSRPAPIGWRGVELGLIRTGERGLDLPHAHPVPRDQLSPPLEVHEESVSLLTGDYLVTYSQRAMTDDRVFKAMADPTRRFLLDRLFERDGRTLTELETDLDMTRFGVMKHLRVLEDAGLVVTRRSGREKLHFLNPVPIRLIHDRWIDKYRERQVSALVELTTELEGKEETA